MRTKTIFSVVLVSLLLSTTAAFCSPDSTRAAPRDSSHQKWWAQLNLTDDQKAKLKTLRQEMRESRKANFEKMKVLLDKSKEELLKPAPNKAVLYGYAKELGDLHKAMAEHMADHMLKVKTILTKDQFTKLLSNEMHPLGMREMHKGPHDAPHGQGPGGGPPPDFDD
jgi:Spy/CpxP family protein refolding chaperone